MERTLLRHQATTWELVHVLFGAIEGEAGSAAGGQAADGSSAQGGAGAEAGAEDGEEDGMEGESLHR